MIRPDAIIKGAQLITIGTKISVGYDWNDLNGSSFAITAASGSVLDDSGAEVIASRTATITTGINSAQRTLLTLTAAETADLTDKASYYILWSLTLDDGQTRLVRGPLLARSP